MTKFKVGDIVTGTYMHERLGVEPTTYLGKVVVDHYDDSYEVQGTHLGKILVELYDHDTMRLATKLDLELK